MSMARFPHYIILLPSLTFALSLGYLHGRILDTPSSSIVLRPDMRSLITTVELTGIRNGKLEGIIRGEGRLILGKTPVIGSGCSFSASYSCWWRGLANSIESAPACA